MCDLTKAALATRFKKDDKETEQVLTDLKEQVEDITTEMKIQRVYGRMNFINWMLANMDLSDKQVKQLIQVKDADTEFLNLTL